MVTGAQIAKIPLIAAMNPMTMQFTPLIAVHMTAALGAVALGPVALWARKGATQRPKLHRAFGYAWVTLMVLAKFRRSNSIP